MADRSAFLKLARARFDQASAADDKQRAREQDDLRFYAGDQWPADIVTSRAGQNAAAGIPPIPARPTLTLNMIRDPIRHVLSEEQQADLGIEITPADDFSALTGPIDDTEIELREGLVRRIQRESAARDARSWAFARAATAGRGYYGVMTRYGTGKTFDQDVYVRRFFNQASVSLDPAHEQVDGSDAEWGFVGGDMPWAAYTAEHGKVRDRANRVATADDGEWRALGDDAPDWFTGDGDTRSVRVVEYYYIERASRLLLQLSDGQVFFADELADMPDQASIAMSRTVVSKQVKWAKIDGAQVLDETDWPGQYIPIVKVVGEELLPYDNERRCQGMVRPSRDAQHGLNVMASTEVEVALLQVKTPVLGAAGQFEGFEAAWDAANIRNLSRLEYNIKTDQSGQNILGPPGPIQRDAQQVQVWDGLRSMFHQAIKSTTGIPDPTLGNVDPSLRSGRAIRELVESAKRGTSGYMSNLVKSVTHEARIINDLLFPIYGQRPGRLVQMMTGKHESQSIMVGQPFVHDANQRPQAFNPAQHQGQEPKQYQLTKDANFNVAIRVSKDFDTRRQEEAASLGELIGASPELLTWFGDLYFENQDGPGHKDMADRAKLMLAPPIQASLSGKSPLPPAAQQQMAAMQQQLQQLQQLADKNVTDLKKAQLDADTKKAITAADLDFQRWKIERDSETKITVAELGAKVDRLALFLEERARLGTQETDISHEAIQNEHDRQHEAALSRLEHEQQMTQQQAAHQQGLEAGDQAHGQALEQNAQSAALAPQPEAGA